MKCQIVIVMCLIISTLSAPLQMQWYNQMPMMPTQEELLQEQLLAIQQMQMMNGLSINAYPPMLQNMDPPLLIIMPDDQQITRLDTTSNNVKNTIKSPTENDNSTDKVTENEELDSVIIESETSTEPKPEHHPLKVLLLLPNRGRISLGGIISAIPFLPIEINVPDTIKWIYNGIAGIIGGIGQRPLNRPMPGEMQPASLRVLLKRLQNRNQMNPTPMLLLPEVAQMYPMQF